MASVQALWVDSKTRRFSARIDGVDGPPNEWRIVAKHRIFEPALFDSRDHEVWVVCRDYQDGALDSVLQIGQVMLLGCSEAVIIRCSTTSILDRTTRPQPQLAVDYQSEAPLFPVDVLAPGSGILAKECFYPADLGAVPVADELLVPAESERRALDADAPSSPEDEEDSTEDWTDNSSDAAEDDETLPDPDELILSEASDQEPDEDIDPRDEPEEEDEDGEDLTVDVEFVDDDDL
jgi:hypothetical protein